jgi:hypothetical protein
MTQRYQGLSLCTALTRAHCPRGQNLGKAALCSCRGVQKRDLGDSPSGSWGRQGSSVLGGVLRCPAVLRRHTEGVTLERICYASVIQAMASCRALLLHIWTLEAVHKLAY